VAARDVRRGETAVARINALVSKLGGVGRASFELLDLASFESVAQFTDRWLAANNTTALSAIILNAGLIAPQFGTTIDGLEQTLQVRHIQPS
jgi:NAD(P)-dependent dehydrogenase (short-subunit alcohol dehydrogenase family)